MLGRSDIKPKANKTKSTTFPFDVYYKTSFLSRNHFVHK